MLETTICPLGFCCTFKPDVTGIGLADEAVVALAVVATGAAIVDPVLPLFSVAELKIGVVAFVAGTTVPAAGVAPTPIAPVAATEEADAVEATLALPVDTEPPDAVAAPATSAPPPPPPPTPPVTPRSPPGELTDGFTVDCGFTSIAGGITAPPVC